MRIHFPKKAVFALALCSIPSIGKERVGAATNANPSIEQRLNDLEKEVRLMREALSPLIIDSEGQPFKNNLVVKKAVRLPFPPRPPGGPPTDDDIEFELTPIRPCRLLIFVRLKQESSFCNAELFVNSVKVDSIHGINTRGSGPTSDQQSMAAVVDGVPGQKIKILSSKIKEPSSILDHSVTVIAVADPPAPK